MIKIAITGGIGSGKSTVCKMFNELGIDSFDTDYVAKQQYKRPEIKEKVVKLLKDNNILVNGEIDTKLISKLCTDDTKLINILTYIVTSGLYEEYDTFLKNSKSPYTLFESAIILNTDNYTLFDAIIGVISDKDSRIDRVIKRSGLTKEEINSRINNQVSDEDIISKSQYVINNNCDLEDLKKQVLDIHSKILSEK